MGSGYRICGAVTDGEKIYALSKASNASGGIISSASLYYVRDICVSEDEEGEGEIIAMLDFPAMPFMAGVAPGTALGISAGQAYRLAYDGSSPSYESVTFPDTTTISAFCMAGS